jgi:Putative prokaryotic signal transducing protein
MGELVTVSVVQTEGEAVSLCALLQSAGIEAIQRPTNMGVGAYDGWAPGGPREIVVDEEDAELAREVLRPQP